MFRFWGHPPPPQISKMLHHRPACPPFRYQLPKEPCREFLFEISQWTYWRETRIGPDGYAVPPEKSLQAWDTYGNEFKKTYRHPTAIRAMRRDEAWRDFTRDVLMSYFDRQLQVRASFHWDATSLPPPPNNITTNTDQTEIQQRVKQAIRHPECPRFRTWTESYKRPATRILSTLHGGLFLTRN